MSKQERVILTLLLSALTIAAAAWVLSLERGWY